ncbi:MAG: hypothetical protein ACI9C1_002066 [Candidatus Aldehydirespiratoraceae bacterium]
MTEPSPASTRALLHLVAADGADLVTALRDLPSGLVAMTRHPSCFMGEASPHAAAIEAPIDYLGELMVVAGGLAELIDAERSMAIVGADRVFIAPPETASPVRYQYLMHRRDDFTHAEYLARYESIHSEFGLRTPNLAGYVQFHVDLEASAELATRTGCHAEPCDSMSELHLDSMEHFIEGVIAHPEVGAEAQADEERFVARDRSFGFTHTVLWETVL